MIHFKYKSFLTVTLKHAFYRDEISQDFVFTAASSTKDRLAALALQPRNVNGRLILYQQLDASGTPFQEIDDVTDLYFLIQPHTDVLNLTETSGAGKYWFTNLKDDGTYANVLTSSPTVTTGDALPEISAQQKVLHVAPGAIANVVLKRIAAAIGWSTIHEIAVHPKADSVKLAVNTPGFYLLEQVRPDNTKTEKKIIMSDELATRNAWAVVHIQLKPGDKDLAYNVTLKPQQTVWQYYLVETKRRAFPIDPAKLSLKYSSQQTSRYPANVSISRVPPGSFSEATKRYIEAIKDPNPAIVKDVYLYESSDKLMLFDGEQPEVKIIYDGQDMTGRITIPRRSMKHSIITYKL